MSDDLPIEIISDLTAELHRRVSDAIKSMIGIVDSPKDKFRVSLGALSAALGSIAGIFSAAYKLPKDDKLGIAVAMAILELGEKAKTMTHAEWEAFAQSTHRPTNPEKQ